MSFLFDNIFSIAIASIVVLLYIIIRKKSRYFADRNIICIEPTLIDQMKSLKVTHLFESPNIIYDKYKTSDVPYIGFYSTLLSPVVFLFDNNLIETILIKDFSHFENHGLEVDYETNPLFGHLFNMKGDQWRTMRHKLTPTFTSGKLKGMIPIIEQCSDNLIKQMEKDNILKKEVNLKQLLSNYTLAVIAICAFGIEPASLNDPDCEFIKIVKQLTNPSYLNIIKLFFLLQLPNFSKFFKIKFGNTDLNNFFFGLTRDAFEMRKKSGVKRNDFIQLLLELKEKGSVEVDTKDLEEDEKEKIKEIQSTTNTTKLELTDELLTAQVFIFLFAGFDNSSYLAAITIYFLSKHPEIQKRVREEVKEIKNKHGGIDYLALREMKFLGACVDEALRLHPPVEILLRECSKTYTLKDGNTFEKGLKLIIPTKGIHRDVKYWTNPDTFNPDRFLQENIHPGSYLPFGDGPRICIAQRLALIIGKMMIAKLIEEYEFLPSTKTNEPLKIALFKGADIIGGLWASFKKLET